MIGWMIVACEIGFWIFVLMGLCVRYVLGYKKLGAALLLCTPLIDLVLIITTIFDIKSGETANFFHGVAAIYIGLTIVFGHSVIKWADARFAYRFAGGPEPVPPAKFGQEHAKRERAGWFKHLLAWTIGNLILLGMILYIGNAEQTQALSTITKIWTVVLVIDFYISFSYTIWKRKGPSASKEIA